MDRIQAYPLSKKVIHNLSNLFRKLSSALSTFSETFLFMSVKIIPWLSPRLSQSMAGVLIGLGHSVKFPRGEVIYSSPGLFEKLMFVRSGFVVKALLDPVREEPLLVSVAGAGALCGSYENLYVRDRMPRRHWCLTSTEVLVVNQELLLKIADEHSEWQRELSSYSSSAALCDRMGMVLNHSGTIEQRLGALLILMLQENNPNVMKHFLTPGIEWVELPFLPDKTTIARLLGCGFTHIEETIRAWVAADVLRKRGRKIWFRRQVFENYWHWLLPFLQQQSA